MKNNEIVVFFIMTNEKRAFIDWYQKGSMINGLYPTDQPVFIEIDRINGYNYVGVARTNAYVHMTYTLSDPFTVLKNGAPFFKITDPESIAKISALIMIGE